MSEPTHSPEIQPRKPSGGFRFHKHGCICIACRAARKRAEAAGSGGPGDAGVPPTKSETEAATGIRPRTTGLLGPAAQAGVSYSTRNKAGKTAIDADVPIKINARGHRDRIAQWVALKAANPGITNVEVAKRLGLAPNTLNTLISRARREGWLTFDNPLDRIEHDLIPKTLDNIEFFLDARDKDVSVEAMKAFVGPTFREARGLAENRVTVLALKIEMPEGDPSAVVRGTISGAPRLSLPGTFDVIDVDADPSSPE